MSVILELIHAKLDDLKSLDKHLELFGASSHEYKFNPIVSVKEIDEFEIKYACSLPKVYREFLLKIGNGGAGPGYGLFPLEKMDDCFDLKKWSEVFVNPLKPFTFTESLNDTSILSRGEPEESNFSSVEKYNEACEVWADEEYEALQNEYWVKHALNGAIPICHHGCANRSWMVISNGLEHGNIWYDRRSNEGGVSPESEEGKERMKFEDWYLGWLDTSINQLNGIRNGA